MIWGFEFQNEAVLAVAELGTAHGGDLQKGIDLIDAAAESGADIAKFQVVFADEILPPQAGLVPLPGGDTPLYQVFKSLERPAEFYSALFERCVKRNIAFLASPFGEKSVRILEEIGVSAWKIASPELNHEPLLERVAGTGLPIVLSTGVSLPEDIERALKLIQQQAASIVLLHCLTCYPAPEDQANLRAIPAMTKRYGVPVGFSDHSLDPVFLPSLAAALGAVLVEKHMTLDRKGDGLDDKIALIPNEFAQMAQAMRTVRQPAAEEILTELSKEYGANRVNAALGDGNIGIAPSEKAHYRSTRRSLHAVGSLNAGTLLNPENTRILRTEKVLRVGIEPHLRHTVYGRRLKRDVPAGEGIRREDIERLL